MTQFSYRTKTPKASLVRPKIWAPSLEHVFFSHSILLTSKEPQEPLQLCYKHRTVTWSCVTQVATGRRWKKLQQLDGCWRNEDHQIFKIHLTPVSCGTEFGGRRHSDWWMSFICHQQVELHEVILDGRWHHQKWPLILPAGRGVQSLRCCSLCRREIKVKLCQKPLSKQDECVRTLPPNRVISLQTAGAVWDPFIPGAMLWGLIHPSTQTHTYWHVHSHMPAHRYLRTHTSHPVPWWRHFCGKLEWHQLHSDKNGFGPGCWLSNTFWSCSIGRFIRSQIRRLTFTPKHISH